MILLQVHLIAYNLKGQGMIYVAQYMQEMSRYFHVEQEEPM